VSDTEPPPLRQNPTLPHPSSLNLNECVSYGLNAQLDQLSLIPFIQPPRHTFSDSIIGNLMNKGLGGSVLGGVLSGLVRRRERFCPREVMSGGLCPDTPCGMQTTPVRRQFSVHLTTFRKASHCSASYSFCLSLRNG